jgi:hypothetical protein
MSQVGFADAGSSGESFSLAIADIGADGVAHIVNLSEHVPPFQRDSAVAEYAGALRERGLSVVYGDNYSSRWAIEAFARHRIGYQRSGQDRRAIYSAFWAHLKDGRIVLLDHAGLRAQVRAWQSPTLHGGPDHLLAVVAGAAVTALDHYAQTMKGQADAA